MSLLKRPQIQDAGQLVGWPSGKSMDSQDTHLFSALSGVKSMNEIFPLERNWAYERMMGGKVRFRAVQGIDWILMEWYDYSMQWQYLYVSQN